MDKQQPRQIKQETATRYDAAPAPSKSWQEQAAERQLQGYPTFRAHFDEPEGWRR